MQGAIPILRLVRVDYHGAKEVPNGTCRSILKAAEIH
jgi:predicted RNA binding protein YcfA (HicA-like mRNA interferase family)